MVDPIADLRAALTRRAPPAELQLVMDWSIDGRTQGRLVIRDGVVAIGPVDGDTAQPDTPHAGTSQGDTPTITLDVDRDAADAIRAGTLAPQRALILGSLRVSGDPRHLRDLAALLAPAG